MPCNLAVTITKATVLPEHLYSLLTPEIVKTIVRTFLQKHPDFQRLGEVTTLNLGREVGFEVSDFTIIVTETMQVSVETYRWNRTRADELSEGITTLLSKAADKLFAAQVQQSLSKLGRVQSQTASVDNQGQQQSVTVFSVEL